MFEISYNNMFLRKSLSGRDPYWNISDERDVSDMLQCDI